MPALAAITNCHKHLVTEINRNIKFFSRRDIKKGQKKQGIMFQLKETFKGRIFTLELLAELVETFAVKGFVAVVT